MILYKNKNNSLDIFSLNYKENDVISFKEEQMKKIPDEEKIFIATSFPEYENNNDFLEKNDRLYIPIDLRNTKKFYLMKSNLNSSSKNNILTLYYNNYYRNLSAHKSDYLRILKYYLIDIKKPKNTKDRNCFGSVIQTPEELYYLQLIFNEQFNFLIDNNVLDEVLELFSIKQIDEIDIENLNINHYGINKRNLKNALKKANNDEFLIKKLTRK